MVIFKTKTGIVPANENEILFTDVLINDDSIIEVYFTRDDVYVESIRQEDDNVYVTISSHVDSVGVKLFINNVDSFSPYDDSYLRQHVDVLDEQFNAMAEFMGELQEDVENNTTSINLNSVNIGDLSTLLTTEKNNLVDALNENFINVSNGKQLLAEAITDKGIETSANDTFEVMASNISNISGGGTEGADAHFLARSTESVSGASSINFVAKKSGTLYCSGTCYGDNYFILKVNNTTIPAKKNAYTSGHYVYFSEHETQVQKGDVISYTNATTSGRYSTTMYCIIE